MTFSDEDDAAFNNDPRSFRLVFVEASGRLWPIEYTMATPHECAFVVAKIKYNLRRRDRDGFEMLYSHGV